MGVASGLGTFRGAAAGVWPPLAGLGLDFTDMSCPDRFDADDEFGPTLAWSFWKFRHDAYTNSTPHEGYSTIIRWCNATPKSFCVTSNIDGHWEAAGFPPERICEVHGSVRFSQCIKNGPKECPSAGAIWKTDKAEINALQVDPETGKVVSPLPKCGGCGGLARPNVVMFGDWTVVGGRINAMGDAYNAFMADAVGDGGAGVKKVVVLEIGAGVAVSTIRSSSRSLCHRAAEVGHETTLIRINPEHPSCDEIYSSVKCIPIAKGTEAIAAIDAEVKRR